MIDPSHQVNGLLQPLTGVLADLHLLALQVINIRAITSDDPDQRFQAPGPTDVRDMCPTLNTLANHDYSSHDRIKTFAEAANAVQTGFGFGFGLSVFLSAFGLLAAGDLMSGKCSIGGAND
ncbi:hypothetical protein SLS56_004041 [Neofusicoccum ribis]|uniref:Heme haloperoxidase family profile domain-containing protein n=1 Tax=Neofusicoccum ribis TaxID=45134 RepID=A0ABR3SZ37_9PEZI